MYSGQKYPRSVPQDDDVSATPRPTNAGDAVRKTFRYFEKTITEDGHWACDYGGPLFLLPGTKQCRAEWMERVPINTMALPPPPPLSSWARITCLCLHPGLVFSCYITGGMEYLTEAQCIEIRRYLFGQIKAEGGWGMYETAHARATHARGSTHWGRRVHAACTRLPTELRLTAMWRARRPCLAPH